MTNDTFFGSLFDDGFDGILSLAAHLCETDGSAIGVFANGHITFRATLNISLKGVSTAFPDGKNDPLIVPDISSDSNFTDSPLLKAENSVRFFAAIPINTAHDVPGLYLCVMDRQVRTITEKQLSGLQLLSCQVSDGVKLKAENVTLRKSREDLRDIEIEMSTIFQNAIDAVVVIDGKGVILQWNPKAASIFGWRAAEVTGRQLHEIIIPEHLWHESINYLKDFSLNPDRNIERPKIETIALRKDRSRLDIAFGISPVTINSRNIYICFISDITDRKLVAQQLDKQKAFYENILNKLPTDIAVFDANHKYLFVNPGAISIKEYREFIIGKDDYEYAAYRNRDRAVADSRREMFLQVKNSGKEIRWEENIKDPKGNTLTHLRRMFPVFNENAELQMVIGFGIEITDRKLMEEKQVALVRQLSAQNTQLIDFCNIVSHNLRAPLVNMSMLVDFIKEAQDITEQKLLISKLTPVIENLHSTFNELVESIQIKQDLEIKSEDIPLKSCLKRAIEGLEPEIEKSGAVILDDFASAPNVYFPPKYLNSIFHNLVSNSLKYRSSKRALLIKLQSKKLDGKVLFSVSDNGSGIDLVKQKDNIFKIGKVFHRHPNAKGFGLYMTKTQVEAMNGRIWAESTPDGGSTFFIEFTNQNA